MLLVVNLGPSLSMTPSEWIEGLASAERNAKIATAYATRIPPPGAYQVLATIPDGRYEHTLYLTGSELVNALRAGWTLWDSFTFGWEWVLSTQGYLCQIYRIHEALAFYKQVRHAP